MLKVYLQGPDSAVENHKLHPSYCCSCSCQKREQSEGRKGPCHYENARFDACSIVIHLLLRSFSVCWKTWWTWTQLWWSSVAAIRDRSQYVYFHQFRSKVTIALGRPTGCRRLTVSGKLPMNVRVFILCLRRGIFPKRNINWSSSVNSSRGRPSFS